MRPSPAFAAPLPLLSSPPTLNPAAPTCCASSPSPTPATPLLTRRTLLSSAAAAALAAVLPRAPASAAPTTTPSGLSYTVTKPSTGPAIAVGDLVALRFRGTYNNVVFDDLFATPEPYFYRAGGENILPGIKEAVPLMAVGEQWALEIPAALAFGDKGRRASAGKPSIPGGATVFYDLLVESIPGRMPELIEISGDDYE